MACHWYKDYSFRPDALSIIDQAERILDDFRSQGYQLTLRQLYYQFVASDLLPNTPQSYKRLGSIINNARLAGMLDWDMLVDRTRNLEKLATWNRPVSIVRATVRAWHMDLWEGQDYRPEVWIEKEALVGIIESTCEENDVPYFACRGYVSQSEMWAAGQRLLWTIQNGQVPVVIHLGDHDPSGVDMTRDIRERLALFTDDMIDVIRIALTMDQIDQYSPPPNPAKITDTRARDYINEHGWESWELDALRPDVINQLILDELAMYRDQDIWDARVAEQERHRETLNLVAGNFNTVVAGLRTQEADDGTESES